MTDADVTDPNVTDADETDADELTGSLIAGRYRLVEPLGSGSMGEVWQAHDERLDRTVALKRLLPARPGQDNDQAVREARIAARVHHPGAVTVHDVVDDEGTPCLVMAYVPGVALTDRSPLAPLEVARIGQQVAGALAAAHEVGVVHRDVKPDNVLLTDDGDAVITDFGISRVLGDGRRTGPGIVAGTPAYLAPEVAAGGDASFASDVFSLGATLYAAVQGAPPFGFNDNTIAMLRRVAEGDVPEPDEAGPLSPALMWMLRRDPATRPTMAQVADALGAVADGRPVVPPTPTLLLDTSTRPLGARTVAITLAAAGLLVVGLIVGLAIGRRPAQTQNENQHQVGAPPPAAQPVSCVADYHLNGSWPGGYQGQVTVTAGDKAVAGWTVTLDLPSGQTVDQLWNGALTHDGSSVQVGSVSYNSAMKAEASTTFGFNGSVTQEEPQPPVVHCTAHQ